MPDASTLEQQIRSTPGLLQALIANQKKPLQVGPKSALQVPGNSPLASQYQVKVDDLLQQYGVTNPGGDYIIGIDKTTQQPYVRDQSWFERNASWVMPLAIVGGGAVLGAATAGTAATTPAISSAAGGAGTSGIADGAATSFASAGNVAPAVAPAVPPAAAAGSGLWGTVVKTALGTAVPAAASLIGANMQANASQSATDASAKANADALDWLKTQYNTRQTQLAPYIQAGQGAIGTMGRSMGVTGTPTSISPQGAQMSQGGGSSFSQAGQPNFTATPATPQTQATPTAQNTPAATNPAPEPLVTMQAPNGQTQQVPASQEAFYVSKGAKRVA